MRKLKLNGKYIYDKFNNSSYQVKIQISNGAFSCYLVRLVKEIERNQNNSVFKRFPVISCQDLSAEVTIQRVCTLPLVSADTFNCSISFVPNARLLARKINTVKVTIT
jgi:hypothetical protein